MNASALITSGVTRPPALRITNHRIAEAEGDDVRGVDVRIEAGDDERAQRREDNSCSMAAGCGEDAIALEC